MDYNSFSVTLPPAGTSVTANCYRELLNTEHVVLSITDMQIPEGTAATDLLRNIVQHLQADLKSFLRVERNVALKLIVRKHSLQLEFVSKTSPGNESMPASLRALLAPTSIPLDPAWLTMCNLHIITAFTRAIENLGGKPNQIDRAGFVSAPHVLTV